MQLQEAIMLVQAKFNAEAQGQTGGEETTKYEDAFDQWPVTMEIATQFFADQIIQQNYEARKAAAIQAAQQQAAEAGEAGGEAPKPS